MTSYQLRDTSTRQLLAHGLADYAAAEAAADRLDDELEYNLAANGEGAGRVRLRLDIEKVTNGVAEPVGHHVLLLGVDEQPAPAPSQLS
ncbi:hypothetical protein [Streptomyces sp. NPDC054837]